MGFFRRKEKKVEIKNLSSYDIERNLEEAIEYAQDLRVKLNYTNESISRLDDVLLIYYKDMQEYDVPNEDIENTAKLFGTYLGEVIRRNWLFDYVWNDSNFGGYMHPVLEKNIDENTSFCIDPVDEVFNRMKCGDEHQSMYCYFVSAK